MKRLTPRGLRENLRAWLLILPSVVFIGMFTLWPLVQVSYSSLERNDLSTPVPRFIGLENYRSLAEDPVFLKIALNTLWYALATIPLSVILALALAMLVHSGLDRVKPFLQMAWFYPTFMPLVAVANIWLFIYTPSYGLLDAFLSVFGMPAGNWLGNPQTVMPALAMLYIWKQCGYFMIFFLAGLQQINGEYYEAALLDGAGPWRLFRQVTLPLLMPTVLFVLIIACTSCLRTVDHILIMTRGGPDNASNILLFYIYETAFSFWDMGKASAMTMCLLGLLLAVIVLNLRYFDRKIHYQE